MKFEVRRNSMVIIPEDAADEAFIEDTLGLTTKGDSIPLRRVAVMGIDTAIAYLEAKKSE